MSTLNKKSAKKPKTAKKSANKPVEDKAKQTPIEPASPTVKNSKKPNHHKKVKINWRHYRSMATFLIASVILGGVLMMVYGLYSDVLSTDTSEIQATSQSQFDTKTVEKIKSIDQNQASVSQIDTSRRINPFDIQ